MEQLISKSNRRLKSVSQKFQRELINIIKWDWRLISIIGARGVGKTTLLLQHLKMTYGTGTKAVYISLDDIYFSHHLLVDFAQDFFNRGGEILYIDEVHKYPSWAKEIKNIYDFYPEIKIVFTGSSIIELLKQNVDLSRRALLYELNGLSYREYLKSKQFIRSSYSGI